jgi:hypothetical protein
MSALLHSPLKNSVLLRHVVIALPICLARFRREPYDMSGDNMKMSILRKMVTHFEDHE